MPNQLNPEMEADRNEKNNLKSFSIHQVAKKSGRTHANKITNVDNKSSNKLTLNAEDIFKDINKLKKEVEIPKQLSEAKILESYHIPDSKDEDEAFSEFGYAIIDGKYYTRRTIKAGKKEEHIKEDVSNFVMKFLYNITNGTNNSTRLIYLQRKPRKNGEDHEKKLIEVRSNEVKPEAFETILKSYGCTFLGNAYTLKKIFAYLMDDEDSAVIISLLGWNSEHQIYAFADSVFTQDGQLLKVDPMGIIKHESKAYYLPAYGLANMTNEDYLNDKSYKFRTGKIGFETWASLFYHASGKNAIAGTLYAIMAMFRDLIFDQLKFFPFFYLFGEKGTGKTSYIQPLLTLIGSDATGTPLNNATVVALSRIVSSRCNSLFYLKEYTTETDHLAEDFILSGYDGAGRETGVKSNDTKTKKFPIRSGIIFDGNALPRKSNILSRMILLTFERTTFSDQQKQAFEQLRIQSQYGFGNVLLEILSMRPDVEQTLKDEFAKSKAKILQAIRVNERYQQMRNADERILQHTSLLFTIYRISKQKLVFPFTENDVLDAIMDIGGSMMEKLRNTDSVTVFWESLAFNINKGQVFELQFNELKQKVNLFE